ncbi:ATP-dependent nuclease [Ensifer sp. LBL]|uniref:ATP-dependent nuclease n=1 Tax=Ensifer sp. LBL TaxID=2991056 RepID=UPI003D197893
MNLVVDARLKEITFTGGLKIGLNGNAILAIIGPNNSGKSTALKEIKARMSAEPPHTKIISSVSLLRKSTTSEIVNQLSPFADNNGIISVPGNSFHLSHIQMWEYTGGIGAFLTRLLVSELDTRTRLSDCDPVAAIDTRAKLNPEHPFQRMYADDGLEFAVSSVFRRAFRMDLVIHRMSGSVIPAYVGQRPKPKRGEDRQSRSYVDRVEQLDKLEEQGDGMRSFASVVGRVITENRPIRLIDEPEAFLHPPQAKILANAIGAQGPTFQTVIATHSSDVIQGLLGDSQARVSVVRLMRTQNGSGATLLSTDDVSRFWNDPILRFSKVLDGLFHDGVIVTEADADCRFYEGLANKSLSEAQLLDVHYAYAGGKDRVPVLVSALSAVEVPVASVLDFDVLNNEQPLKRIIEAHKGDWSKFEPDWLAVKKAVESNDAYLSGDNYRLEVQKQLESYPKGSAVPRGTLSAIKKLSRNASPWDNVKDAGVTIVPKGTPYSSAMRLLSNLREIGVFVAPNGEMEGFCRSIGMHGMKWVEEVMKRDLANDTELAEARTFVAQVFAYLQRKAL